jgi:hypothetical protein
VSLLLLLAALVDAQVARLGADDYATRERATERLSNPLAALRVLDLHDDEEPEPVRDFPRLYDPDGA